MDNDNKDKGKIGEDYAAKVYQRNGYKILIRNFFNHTGKAFGEIDFIALKNSHLHFVETKTRTSFRFGRGIEALTKQKRRRLLITAEYFLRNFFDLPDCQAHFDLAEVLINPFDKNVETITIYSDVIDDYAS